MEPRVGVGAVIVNADGEWLLLQRKRSPEAGCWSIPGGKVDWMETIEEAIVREVKEELGVVVQLERLLGVTNHRLREEDAHWVAPTFQASILEGVPYNVEPEKHEAVRWMHPRDWPPNVTETTKAAYRFFNR